MDTNSLKGCWKAAFCKVFHSKSGGRWFPLVIFGTRICQPACRRTVCSGVAISSLISLAGEWHDFQYWHCYTRSSRSISGANQIVDPKILIWIWCVVFDKKSLFDEFWKKTKTRLRDFLGGVIRIASCLFRMLWNFTGVHWEILGRFSSFSHLGHIWRSWPGQLKTSIEIIWSFYPTWIYMHLDELEANIQCI